MKSLIRQFALLCLSLGVAFGSTLAHAISLEFSPSGQTKYIGELAKVDVRVSNPGGTLVGDFDFWVNYDPNIVELSLVKLGSSLGVDPDILNGTEFQTGRVNVWEVSLLSDLTTVQFGLDDFSLFTLWFKGLHVGTSPLTFTGNVGDPSKYLGDTLGNTIDLDIGRGSITVIDGTNPVPEPGTFLLMGAGLTGFIFWRRTRRSRY